MISAAIMHEEYKRILNRINNEYDTRVGTIDSDAFINMGIDVAFQNLAVKFELNSTVRNHLRQLEVKGFKVKTKKIASGESIIEYPSNFYMLTRQFVVACKEGCTEERVLDVYMIQSSDLNQSLKDPNWKPSFDWEQALAEDAGNGLTIYHDCECDLKSVKIDYLKKPNHIATPSRLKTGAKYIRDGKQITSDIGLEIDSTFFWRYAVDLAVIKTLASLGDTSDYQMQMSGAMALDKIFIN